MNISSSAWGIPIRYQSQATVGSGLIQGGRQTLEINNFGIIYIRYRKKIDQAGDN